MDHTFPTKETEANDDTRVRLQGSTHQDTQGSGIEYRTNLRSNRQLRGDLEPPLKHLDRLGGMYSESLFLVPLFHTTNYRFLLSMLPWSK